MGGGRIRPRPAGRQEATFQSASALMYAIGYYRAVCDCDLRTTCTASGAVLSSTLASTQRCQSLTRGSSATRASLSHG